MDKIITVIACLLWVLNINAQQLTKDNVNEVVEQLSLDEKINLVVGVGMYIPGITPEEQKIIEKVPGAAGHSYAIDRIGLPTIVLADGPAGVRINPERPNDEQKYYATAFPIATLMASSWDVDLMQQVGQAFGNESKEYGVDILLAPALNIHRQPLTGRNFEYYSEDPLLSGKMTAAFVKGVQSQGVGTSIKHFAANNQETNRTTVNTIVSERAMREIYLKGFEIAVKEAQPWTVMSAYNRINGVYSSQRYDLLTSILRDEWGYEGFVMTDWFAGDNAVEQMKAGNDLLMPGIKQQKEAIKNAVENGELSMDILNKNATRILKIYTQTHSFNNYNPTGKPELEANKNISRNAASQGMVLLKNTDNTLPLKKDKSVALFGVAAYETFIGGTGSGDVNNKDDVNIIDGFKNSGIQLNEGLAKNYQQYINEQRENMPPKKFFFEPDLPIVEKNWTIDEIKAIAQQTDVAVYTLGRSSGEFKDRAMEDDYLLNEKEFKALKLISETFQAQGKKLVVVLNIGGVIETVNWKDYADAILIAWQPGQEAGNALVDVLSGKVNPSGKLTMTFPIKYEDHLASNNFPGKEFDLPAEGAISFMAAKPAEVKYEEGVFVGYRHFETAKVKTSFPFGYGLSYSSFEYSKLKVKQKGNNYNVSCIVTNSGTVAGKEVVQLYISAPESELAKPLRELKAFAKTRLLKPSQKQTLSFTLSNNDFASYYTEKSAWIAEEGSYKIQIGSSVAKIELEEQVNIEKSIVTDDLENQFKETKLNLEEKEKANKAKTKALHPAKVFRNVEWTKVKGMSLTMDIHVPQTGKESYPVLVVYHGGGWLINNKSIMEEMSEYISTQSEYIVCNVDYRLLGDNNNTTHMNEIIEDALGALLWIKENIAEYKGDFKRIALTGDSAGGHLASSVMLFGRKLSSDGFSADNTLFKPSYIPKGKTINDILNEDMLKVQAAIISYGTFDIYGACKGSGFESQQNFFWTMGGAQARGLFGNDYTVETHAELYKAVSPIYHIPDAKDYQLPPQLFTVGSKDNTTSPESIKTYVAKVKEAGHPAKLWIYEGKPHAFLDSGSNEFLGTSFENDAIEAINIMVEFLDEIF